jgi:hypothetical protein
MRIINNFKLYQIIERAGYFKVYIYKLKKATSEAEAVNCFDAEGLYARSLQELEDFNVLDKNYYNEEQYYYNESNKIAVLGSIMSDIMNYDTM